MKSGQAAHKIKKQKYKYKMQFLKFFYANKEQ